jgi:hypothetical protein
MSIPPTPDFIAKIQPLFEEAVDLTGKTGVAHCVNVDTMKIVKVLKAKQMMGRFTTGCNENIALARWCQEHIGFDPLEDTHVTPGLFRDGSNARIMQIIQALWNRVDTLEDENRDLRYEVRAMHRMANNRDD